MWFGGYCNLSCQLRQNREINHRGYQKSLNMKKLFFLMIVAGFQLCHSQENTNIFIQKQFVEQHSKWFPEDAEWIYMRPSPSGPEVEAVPFYVKGDTVINEKKCVMTNFRSYFLGGKGLCFYEENDSVFYY